MRFLPVLFAVVHPEGLSPDKIALLTEWVVQGALWDEHWSFVPPREAPLPDVRQTELVQQPLDRFLLARFAAEELEPSTKSSPASPSRPASSRRSWRDPWLPPLELLFPSEELQATR